MALVSATGPSPLRYRCTGKDCPRRTDNPSHLCSSCILLNTPVDDPLAIKYRARVAARAKAEKAKQAKAAARAT